MISKVVDFPVQHWPVGIDRVAWATMCKHVAMLDKLHDATSDPQYRYEAEYWRLTMDLIIQQVTPDDAFTDPLIAYLQLCNVKDLQTRLAALLQLGVHQTDPTTPRTPTDPTQPA